MANTISSSVSDDGNPALAEGPSSESLQTQEPGERQISYQAMTFVRFRIAPWALNVCTILALGEPKAKQKMANITKAKGLKQWI